MSHQITIQPAGRVYQTEGDDTLLAAAIRNPSAAAGERPMLFLGMALTEALGIFALVIAFLILFA